MDDPLVPLHDTRRIDLQSSCLACARVAVAVRALVSRSGHPMCTPNRHPCHFGESSWKGRFEGLWKPLLGFASFREAAGHPLAALGGPWTPLEGARSLCEGAGKANGYPRTSLGLGRSREALRAPLACRGTPLDTLVTKLGRVVGVPGRPSKVLERRWKVLKRPWGSWNALGSPWEVVPASLGRPWEVVKRIWKPMGSLGRSRKVLEGLGKRLPSASKVSGDHSGVLGRLCHVVERT